MATKKAPLEGGGFHPLDEDQRGEAERLKKISAERKPRPGATRGSGRDSAAKEPQRHEGTTHVLTKEESMSLNEAAGAPASPIQNPKSKI